MDVKVPFVDLRVQYRNLRAEIDSALARVLERCDFILGSEVENFERRFAEYLGVAHAVGVSSGLDALHLALRTLGIGPGDEVIIPANTFVATALAVSTVGARPVLVDCVRDTYNIDPDWIESAITPRTRAIIPVHLTGQAADMDAVLSIAAKYGLWVIEDAAQAHGTLYKGRKCGSLAPLGCFSFYPGKNLGAYGDAGLVATDNDAFAEKIRRLRNYGQRVKYEHIEKGMNCRLDTLQAAVLNVKLRYLDEWNRLRARHADAYRALLENVGDLRFQRVADFSTHIYHLFIVETEYRDALRQYLAQKGVQTGIHYPIPIHLLEAYRDLGYQEGDFPHTEYLAKHMLSLPMYPELTEEQIDYVALCVREFFNRMRSHGA
ncbi:MAG: DegT/DnrJ/EryC1/StrS family aminotransferase [candidate division KSB1 bacterium]|nr:DegT/DnrJ/EryC1/StrS family aminotransferase [candidate division KSB1 bacterium]